MLQYQAERDLSFTHNFIDLSVYDLLAEYALCVFEGGLLWTRSSSRNSDVSDKGNQSCVPGAGRCQGYEGAKALCWLTATVKDITVIQHLVEGICCQPTYQHTV